MLLLGVTQKLVAGSVLTAFDPAKTAAGATLSNGNRTLTWASSPNQEMAYGTNSKSSGTWYVEFLISTIGAFGAHVGFGDGTTSLTSFIGGDTHSVGYSSDGNIYSGGSSLSNTGSTYTTGDIISITVNAATSGTVFKKNNTTVYTYAGSALSTPIYFAGEVVGTGGVVVVQTGASGLTYSVPGGATAW